MLWYRCIVPETQVYLSLCSHKLNQMLPSIRSETTNFGWLWGAWAAGRQRWKGEFSVPNLVLWTRRLFICLFKSKFKHNKVAGKMSDFTSLLHQLFSMTPITIHSITRVQEPQKKYKPYPSLYAQGLGRSQLACATCWINICNNK